MTNWEKAASELMQEAAANAEFSSQTISVGFKRLTDGATIPTKAHPTDSGFDLYASEDIIIEPGETVIVPTGIAVELPKGHEAQVRSRSGVTAKTKLRVQLGTIDQDYRGEIGVIVDNNSISIFDRNGNKSRVFGYIEVDGLRRTDTSVNYPENTYLIRKGDRIAQLVVQALPEVTAVEIEEFTEDSDRGEDGFGSSGV